MSIRTRVGFDDPVESLPKPSARREQSPVERDQVTDHENGDPRGQVHPRPARDEHPPEGSRNEEHRHAQERERASERRLPITDFHHGEDDCHQNGSPHPSTESQTQGRSDDKEFDVLRRLGDEESGDRARRDRLVRERWHYHVVFD